MPASKRKSTAYSLFVPLEAKDLKAYQNQYQRLSEIMGPEMADRYFVWTEPNPVQVPNAETLSPGHEARELHKYMERNSLTLEEMRKWILVSEEEARVIERWCGSDLSLLGFTNRMIDFRREVWGALLVLLEKKGHQHHASRKFGVDRQFTESPSAMCG